jgi:acyl carrier protein
MIGDAEQSHAVFLNIVNRIASCNDRCARASTFAGSGPLSVRICFDKVGVFQYILDIRRLRRDIMDKMEIQEKIVNILARHTSLERSAFTPGKDLKLDLGLDSLDVAEIVYEMEGTFGISISDESAEKLRKISDTVDFVHDRMAESSQDGLSVQER